MKLVCFVEFISSFQYKSQAWTQVYTISFVSKAFFKEIKKNMKLILVVVACSIVPLWAALIEKSEKIEENVREQQDFIF